jgi:hypothetical protein
MTRSKKKEVEELSLWVVRISSHLRAFQLSIQKDLALINLVFMAKPQPHFQTKQMHHNSASRNIKTRPFEKIRKQTNNEMVLTMVGWVNVNPGTHDTTKRERYVSEV